MSAGVLVAVGGAEFEAVLLRSLDGSSVAVVRRCVDVPDLLAAAALQQAQVAVVSAQLRGLDRSVVSRLRDLGVEVVGCTAEASSADEAALRRLGVQAFASADAADSVPEVLTAAATGKAAVENEEGDEPAAAAAPRRDGRIVAVWGPTGAPGRSTVALGLAAKLAALRAHTLLIDADVYGGACASLLGLLDESSGVLAAARAANAGVLELQTLASIARTVSPRLRLLTGLPRADRWTELKPPLVRDMLDTAQGLCDFTVVDTGFSLETDEEVSYDFVAPRRNGATIEVLSGADAVVVVGTADPLGLSRLIRAVHELAAVVPEASPYVVVNRVRDTLGWSTTEMLDIVTRATGVQQLWSLPEDRAACDKALVHGRTLPEVAAESALTAALGSIASVLAGVPDNGQTVSRLRRRLSRR